jgi:hypothetical protein
MAAHKLAKEFPLALDEADHRLFVGMREPALFPLFRTPLL